HRHRSNHRRVGSGANLFQHSHKANGSSNTQRRAKESNDNALNEDLDEDRDPGRADGLADADLADALVDAGQHDVHNADAADQQADCGDDAAAHAGIMDLLVDGLHLVLLGAEAEVLDAVMDEHEDIPRLLQGGLHLVQAGYLQANVGQPVVRDAAGIPGGPEPDPGGVERHVEGEVLALEGPIAAPAPAFPAGGTSLRFLRMQLRLLPLLLVLFALVVGEHAHDSERLPVEVYSLAYRDDLMPGLLRRPEHLVANPGADDANRVGVFLVEVGEEAPVLKGVEVHLKGRRPHSGSIPLHERLAASGYNDVVHVHLGRYQAHERSAAAQGFDVRHGVARRLVREMFLLGGHLLVVHVDPIRPAHSDHGLAHAVLHACDDSGHADQAGDAQDDAQHGEHGAELVRPHLL